MLVWISGISRTLPVAAEFYRHSDRSRENEMNSTLYKQSWLPCYMHFSCLAIPTQCMLWACRKHVAGHGCVTSFRALVGWRGWARGHKKIKVDHSVPAFHSWCIFVPTHSLPVWDSCTYMSRKEMPFVVMLIVMVLVAMVWVWAVFLSEKKTSGTEMRIVSWMFAKLFICSLLCFCRRWTSVQNAMEESLLQKS